MNWFFGERRKEARRVEAEDPIIKRRKKQRREFFRVVYPRHERPEITNIDGKIIDISIRSMRFEINAEYAEKISIPPGSKRKLQLKFHDEQILEVSGLISPRLDNRKASAVYICIFENEIAPQVIAKEESYLLKNFHDFSRSVYEESL